ncbi:MAG: DUF1579 family protein [Acidobacteriota bacterium]
MRRDRRQAVFLAVPILMLFSVLPGRAQQADGPPPPDPPPPCSRPEAGQFDFWVGDWDLEWGEGKTGTNSIHKVMGGCVITEEFDGSPSSKLRGMSVSSYDPIKKKWKQTWVDNQGGYLDFVGEYRDGKMVLQRNATFEGKPILQRMVWYAITENGLKWNWERSRDGGKSWETLWKIAYTRRK